MCIEFLQMLGLRRPALTAGGGTQVAMADNASRCLNMIVSSTTDGEAELDKAVAPNVTIRKLAPAVTGFPAWSRQESYVNTDADRDRGHADYVVPSGADNSTPRILYCHGGGYEWYSPQDIYRPHTSRLAADTGMPVLCFDYRLIPEFRHPAHSDGWRPTARQAQAGPRRSSLRATLPAAVSPSR
eukprot:CAMPEP_0175485880 /NCGR_PEP_ID=MMETSP0095-20121207/80750_1 /TAXON_ID=311494 /ORGANISM="Alexandrium monilatum, Strain CCMP3105" /LENGTH=184 /DNA_ID=CAMNT_0016787671 /DNA_START=88 /DNA_END=638 /DNA_ORIENTATION=+